MKDKLIKLGDSMLFVVACTIVIILATGQGSKNDSATIDTDAMYHSKEFVSNVNKIIDYNPLVPKIYNATGQIVSGPCKIAVIRTALTVSPQTVDISATGFTSVYMVIPQGENNTTTVTSMPNCSLKSYTTTSAVINTTVANSSLVSVLGVNIVGLTTPASFSGMYVDLIVFGQ